MCASGCTWSMARATAPSLGRLTPGVVKQDKSSGGSVDTTKTRSHPQRVRMSRGERPIGAAKGKQSDTEALCPSLCTRWGCRAEGGAGGHCFGGCVGPQARTSGAPTGPGPARGAAVGRRRRPLRRAWDREGVRGGGGARHALLQAAQIVSPQSTVMEFLGFVTRVIHNKAGPDATQTKIRQVLQDLKAYEERETLKRRRRLGYAWHCGGRESRSGLPPPPRDALEREGGTPLPLQGAQPTHSHCPPDAKCRPQWHL